MVRTAVRLTLIGWLPTKMHFGPESRGMAGVVSSIANIPRQRRSTRGASAPFPCPSESSTVVEVDFTIRPMGPADWPAVRAIYLDGIATGNATFETEAPPWERWDAAHSALCRLVAETGDTVLGFAALSPVSARKVYAGVAEVSVYVSAQARGAGVGKALLHELVRASEATGFWTLQAGIFPENHASLRLHEKCGFRVVGVRKRVGCLAGRWRDVVLLERRSATPSVG